MSEIYISTPNPVIICVDRVQEYIREGYLYHPYNKEGIHFENIEKVFDTMESFYDDLNFPFSATSFRTFRTNKKKKEPAGKTELIRIWTNEELLKKRGKLGSFLVQVQ